MRKILKVFSGLAFAIVFVVNANAIEGKAASEIPSEMDPYTVIVYDDCDSYTILKGGETTTESSVRQKETLTEEYPAPFEGMKVVYGSDGMVSEILDSEDRDVLEQEYYKTIHDSSLENVKSTKSTISATKTLIASWGEYPNRLYKSADGQQITGNGRATTFNDTVGQADHTLAKGDVATKLAYDNCRNGIDVRVKAKKVTVKNGNYVETDEYLTKVMKKWDAGGMPNAIIDIWKSGVSYWGYTYSSSLSLLGKVYMSHENLK